MYVSGNLIQVEATLIIKFAKFLLHGAERPKSTLLFHLLAETVCTELE